MWSLVNNQCQDRLYYPKVLPLLTAYEVFREKLGFTVTDCFDVLSSTRHNAIADCLYAEDRAIAIWLLRVHKVLVKKQRRFGSGESRPSS